MIGCAVIGCNNHSDPRPGQCSSIKVSLHKLSATHDQFGEKLKDYELQKKHLAGYLPGMI